MGAQPVCPKPAPEVVAALCARFGDEARLAVLKMLAAKAESNVDIESPKPAQSASAVPSSPVVEGKDAAPKSPAAAVTTPTSMSPLPPGPSAPPQPTGPVADPAFTDSEIKTLSEPVPFAAWGPLHERALAYMRWRRDSAVASDASLAPSPEAAADMRLWRFVVAKNFDCPGAAEMYIGMLRWRRDAGMDKFRGEVLEANSGFFIDGAALLQTVLPCERDRKVMAAQPRMFTLEVEGGHQLLRDRSGNVVYIECPGTLDYPAILAIGDADYAAAACFSQELQMLVLDELSRRTGRLVLMLRVMDMSGINMFGFGKSRAEKDGEKLAKEATRPFADAYPTTTYKNFLINLPAANAAGPIVKAFVPARSAKKMVLLGGKFHEELHKEVDPSNLPQKLGGVLDDGIQWRKKK